jgi:hypothetical protein
MGRGVATLSNYSDVTYLAYEGGSVPVLDDEGNETDEVEFDQLQSEMDWEDFEYEVVRILQKYMPSMEKPYKPRWDGNEVRIILENSLAEIGLSCYYSVVSLAIRPHEDAEYSKRGIQEKWISQVWPKVDKALADSFPNSVLNRLGTMSNGESVYARAA